MKTLGNIVWFLFSGIEMAIAYLFFGLLLLLPIVTIPFAVQALKLVPFVLWPFGRVLVVVEQDKKPSSVGNVLWLLLAGIWLAIGHVVAALLLAITIVGIPLVPGHFKMASAVLMPFGKEAVPKRLAEQRGLTVAASVG